jgi:membrane protein implicated in regulation of membrane protease activity
MKRKILAAVLLALLLGVPFLNWQLGAVLWMSVWLVYIFQNLLTRRNWKIDDKEKKDRDNED